MSPTRKQRRAIITERVAQRPPPKSGDANPDMTFHAVGAALSAWEHLNTGFTFLFGQMANPTDNRVPHRAYGRIEDFNLKVEVLRAGSEAYFYAAEGIYGKENTRAIKERFDDACITAQGLCARRNEIAHGCVRNILPEMSFEVLSKPQNEWPKGFALFPVIFSVKKRSYTPFTKPHYYYGANEILYYKKEFDELAKELLRIVGLIDTINKFTIQFWKGRMKKEL
ncbi:MAG: hypothetical protein ACRYG6_12635 [Janthinobacterium lividum]